MNARRLKAPRAFLCSFFPPTHPACAGEFLGYAAAPTSSATRTQQRLSTSNWGPGGPGEHCQQAAAAHARQRRLQPRARLQQLQQRRRQQQLRQLPAAPPLVARGGSQCEPPDPGRLGPRSAGGCRRYNLQQPTIGRAAKGAHGPVGWQLAAAPLGCAPERLRGLGSGGARGHMETRGDAGFGG